MAPDMAPDMIRRIISRVGVQGSSGSRSQGARNVVSSWREIIDSMAIILAWILLLGAAWSGLLVLVGIAGKACCGWVPW